MLNTIIENYPDEKILKADGFDDAVIGIEVNSMRLVYSTKKTIAILISRESMTELEALEYFDFNIGGAYVGEKTPIWCDDTFI